jgi:hypothetical protein
MSYNQPLASTTDYGIVKVGSGLSATNGVISATTGLALNYGFISSSTPQTNPVASAINIMTFDTLGPANGVAIGPGNDNIVVTNAGVYTKLFTLTTAKTSGGTATLSIWLRRNGIDLVGSSQELQLTNTLSTVFVSGNYTLNLAAGDNIQMCWSSPDVTTGLAALPALINPIRPSGYAAKVTLTRIS